jgi:polysaccharide chain length determinant protein (PEP-CTERM system associated)
MINPGKPFNIHDYIEILLRRIWYIMIPFVVISIGTGLYALYAPREYQATTLILVTPQKVPEQFVQPTVTSKIEDLLQSISQEILSRTRLEKIISEFKLYSEEIKSRSLEDIVEVMRKNIQIDFPKKEKEKNYFTISYTGKDPKVVTMVTNKLASLFIEENLKFRELQAQGTSEFLSIELKATNARLEEQESAVTHFKKQFMGELPEQREANIRVLDQLMNLYQRISESLRSAQDRKVVIQKQLSDTENLIAVLVNKQEKDEDASVPSLLGLREPKRDPVKSKDPLEIQLEQLKNHLADLQGKYTERHPDIQIVKKMIGEVEGKLEQARKEKELKEKNEAEAPIVTPLPAPKIKVARESNRERADHGLNLRYKEMENQLIATELEIQRLKEEEGKVKAQVNKYRERIENTPIREQAMAQLMRDYQNTKEAYQTLLQKSQSAQQAENLERRQKGEQFKILDPARIPTKPFKPDIRKILFIGFLLGMASGLGLAFFREQLDRSFRDAEDLETTLGIKVLVNIPKIEKQAA